MDRREFQNLLKPSRFGNAEKRRLLQSNALKDKRSYRRTSNFNLRRQIDPEVDTNIIENIPPKSNKLIDRKLALQKFKAEKEAKKKAVKDKKKPPFVVGIPHHGSSPLLKTVTKDTIKKDIKTTANEVRIKRVTRATARTMVNGNVLKEKPKINAQPKKNLIFRAPASVKVFPFKDSKSVFSFQPKLATSDKKLTSPHTPTVLKRSVQKKPPKTVSNSVNKVKVQTESPKLLGSDEVLAAPLALVVEHETTEESLTQEESHEHRVFNFVGSEHEMKEESLTQEIESHEHQETSRISPNKFSVSPKTYKLEPKEDEVDNEESELDKQVAFQHGRLQLETDRLLELAEQWQTVALREVLPEEVVDEVDSLVGQTRLLTSDKFQQFRRLIVQYQQKTGSHPVTLDDLNGFWDMIYLQVESLDKRYAALNVLKNNNWTKPEPERKKKRRMAKTKNVEKITETTNKVPNNVLPQPEDEEVQTPTTSVKPVIASVLLNKKRTRSYSPSPYIAMRLSGIGKTSSATIQTPTSESTPRSIKISPESHGTPRSAHKHSWTKLTESTKKKRTLLSSLPITKIKTEEEEKEELQQPDVDEIVPVTPRRSLRLMSKVSTPASCATCELNSCKKSCQKSEPRQSNMEEAKQATTRVRFSLRPSVLTISENSMHEIPNKVAKRRHASVCLANTMLMEDGIQRRRSNRQSKKVTFEPEVEEKLSSRLPATPYRKSQTGS